MDRLSELLGQAVQFVYTCWDRIVLSGYIERLQRPENLIYFFQDVVGIGAIEPTVLEQRTNATRPGYGGSLTSVGSHCWQHHAACAKRNWSSPTTVVLRASRAWPAY